MAEHAFPTPKSDLLESALKSGGRFPGAGAPLTSLLFGPKIKEEQEMKKRIFEERRKAAQQKALLEAMISRAKLTEFERKEKDAATTAKNKKAFLEQMQKLEDENKLPKGTVERIIERKAGGGGSVKTTQGSTMAQKIQQLTGQGAPGGQRGPGQGQGARPPGIPGQGAPGGQPTGQRSVGGIRVGPSGVSVGLVESLPEELQDLGVKVITGDASPGELGELVSQLKDQKQVLEWGAAFQRARATKEAAAGRKQVRTMQALKTAHSMIQQLTAQVDKLGPKSISETTIIILNRVLKDANIPPVDASKAGWFEELKFNFGLSAGAPVTARNPSAAGVQLRPEAQTLFDEFKAGK